MDNIFKKWLENAMWNYYCFDWLFMGKMVSCMIMDNQVQFLWPIWSILLSDDGYDYLIYNIYHVVVDVGKCSWNFLKIITH